MTVYVDDARNPYGGGRRRMLMSHMASDTSTDELLDFAARLGLQARWLQHAGQPHEHFDVSQGYRKRALEMGAVPCTQRALVEVMRQRWAVDVPRWRA